jgi:hypothetical protein
LRTSRGLGIALLGGITVEPIIPASGNGPWRILILDRGRDDPKWILATVTSPGDVEPADLGDVLAILPAGSAWVRGQLGQPRATLTPMTRAHVWRVDEGGKPR